MQRPAGLSRDTMLGDGRMAGQAEDEGQEVRNTVRACCERGEGESKRATMIYVLITRLVCLRTMIVWPWSSRIGPIYL